MRRIRRPLAAAVLTAFIVLPPIGAWLRLLEASAPRCHEELQRDSKTSPSVKHGWFRKALLPKTAAAVQVTAGCKRLEERTAHAVDLAPQPPLPGTRLDFCSEFTKPASLCLRSMGTPKNHRSPPAALL